MMQRRGSEAARAAWLYYLEELTQEEVARESGVSRSTAVRLLRGAKGTGLVRITLDIPREMFEMERPWATHSQRDGFLFAVLGTTSRGPYRAGRQGVRDRELLEVVNSCEMETANQMKGIRTRMKQAAPKRLIVASLTVLAQGYRGLHGELVDYFGSWVGETLIFHSRR